MRRILSVAAVCAVLLVAVRVPVAGQAATPDPVVEEAGRRLTLDECLRMALANNLDLIKKRKDPLIADQNVVIQDAEFDPLFSGGPSFRGSKSEPQNRFEAAGRNSVGSLGASWRDRLKFGADYTLAFDTSKGKGSNFLYEPSYNSGLSFTFNLPLLRGLGEEVTTEALVLAKVGAEISRDDLFLQAETTMESVEDAYWNLAASRKASEVARQALGLAENLLNLNRKKVDVGTLAPIEITQAEAGVASREEGVIATETLVLNSEDELRRLMGVPKSDPLWNERIIPSDPPTFAARSVDVQESIQKALEARPEIASARRSLSSAQLDERAANNRMKHGLDFQIETNPFGNNLERIDPVDGVVLGGYSSSLTEIPKLNNYDWAVSLIYSIPIGNHAAKAGYAIASLNREKAELDVANAEQTIRVEVRTAARNVDSGAKRVAAARSNVTLQQKKLEAEQKKFDNGMSTSFEVLTFQNDLLDAQVSLIQAMADYNKSLAALERAQGTLLAARGLRLEM